jgi:hypothetical protein
MEKQKETHHIARYGKKVSRVVLALRTNLNEPTRAKICFASILSHSFPNTQKTKGNLLKSKKIQSLN